MNAPLTLDIDLQAEGMLRAHLGVRGGVARWNGLMLELWDLELIGKVWDDEADEPGIILGLRMGDADLAGIPMAGINLGHIYMERCRFDGSDLRGAEIGIARHCTFRGADLRGTLFGICDLTGSDFTGAATDSRTVIETAFHDEGLPPTGLPWWLLTRFRPEPAEVHEPLPRAMVVPVGVTADLIIPAADAFH